jgi:acetyl esterase/lipase
MVAAFLIDSYARAYPGLDSWGYLNWRARPVVADIASRCVEYPDALFSIAEMALLPGEGMFAREPTEGPFGERLAENVPSGPFPMPVMIAQGARDDLVSPPIQQGFVERLCETGAPVAYRLYEGQDHVSIVQPESPLTADLIAWTRDRFAGRDFTPQCAGAQAPPDGGAGAK